MMDMDARNDINLRVLRNLDATVQTILKQSPYVVLYSYSTTHAEWSKVSFEGTLFIYRTLSGHAYRILNRFNLDSFSRPLEDPRDVVETEGYVIHRIGEEIWGLWIWDDQDRRNIYDAMVLAAQSSQRSMASQAQDNATKKDVALTEQKVTKQGSEIPVDSLFAGSAAKRPWTPTTVTM